MVQIPLRRLTTEYTERGGDRGWGGRMIRDLRHLRQRGICYGILERYLQNCVIAEKKEGRTMKHIMWMLGNAMRRGVIWLLIGGLLGMPLEAAPHQRSPHGDTPTQTVGCSFATFKDRTWVTGTGRITRILPDDLVPPCHQRFIVADGDGRTVLIVNNIDEWPRLEDVNVGDDVSFRGEFIANAKGGLVHWTHPDKSGRRSGGWVKKTASRGPSSVQRTQVGASFEDETTPSPERREYFAGRGPIPQRTAAPVNEDWPETGYWLSTNSGVRHNTRCENYRKTRGYPCTKTEGRPCGRCGG